MSGAPHDTSDIRNAGIGGDQHPTQSAPDRASHGVSNFVDGSGPIFSMYLEMATEEDKKMVEGWKADADGILIFTGLFSAAVASLISVSIQDIRPNPQDTSNFYLANIYQATLAGPASNISTSLPTSPPPFSPPNYAVWVNALLFLSLVISISCALLATLLQQWARRYLKVTQPRYSLHKRARIRAFFFEGVEKFLLPWAVEALPTLLHISLFLFFAGVSVFLWNVDLTIFKAVVVWIGICTALYGCITFFPIFYHDSPYHTPLSLPAQYIVTGISYLICQALRRLAYLLFLARCLSAESFRRSWFREEEYRKRYVQGMKKRAEETALELPLEIDTRAFMWTFESLDEDHELERFFSGLPGLRSSKVVKDPLSLLTPEQKEKLSVALEGLFDRTFSSDLLPESVKNWRAIICARALDPAQFPYEYDDMMDSIMHGDRCMGLQTSKFGCTLRGWGNGGNQGAGLVTRVIVTNIIATSKQRDDSWFILASSELGVPEPVLRDYAANGNSLSLAVLIHVVRQQFDHFRNPFWPSDSFRAILELASHFNVRDASPELQHEFCALWNQVVRKAQNDERQIAFLILKKIQNIYVSLHRDTDSAPTRFSVNTPIWDNILDDPSTYPVCTVADHTHNPTSTFARNVLHDHAALVPAFPNPDAPSSSVPAPLGAIESFTGVSPLNNFHPHHQSTIESLRVPVALRALATTSLSQDTVNSGIKMLRSTPETSTRPPFFPISPPAAVALKQHAESPTSSDLINLPPSAPSGPVFDNILATVTAISSASPRPPSSPNLGVAAEGDGNQKPGFHSNNDAPDSPSTRTIHTNTMPALDRPPQPLSLSFVTGPDVVTAGPSEWEPNVERTGDCRSSSGSFTSPV